MQFYLPNYITKFLKFKHKQKYAITGNMTDPSFHIYKVK